MILENPHQTHDQSNLLKSMFLLRAKVFKYRFNWNVTVQDDGQEIDCFDHGNCKYSIISDENERALASCRIMDFSGPTLLTSVFHSTIPDCIDLKDPGLIECTRFCVDLDHAEYKVNMQLLVSDLKNYCKTNLIHTALGNVSSPVLRLCGRFGFDIEPIGCTHSFGDPVYLCKFPI